MHKVTDFLLKRRIIILAVFALLVAASLFITGFVNVNYDLAKYLPEESNTKKAVDILTSRFGYPGSAEVMVEDIGIPQAAELKRKMLGIDGVSSVLWLDDLTDINVPEEAIPASVRENYYKDKAALFRVEFEQNDYGLKTGDALLKIRELVGDKAAISGSAENSRGTRGLMADEIFKIMLVVVPICVLILMFASHSWAEPVFYLTVIGVSIALNMGTNVFLGSVSYITHAMSSVLQLAISLDYSLFLLHRYTEEREGGADVVGALKTAMRQSIASISASAATTIAGFLALLFMQYGIGRDIGIVLAKGIIFSFICTITLLPILIYLFHGLLEKTAHKPFIPPFGGLGKLVIKLRWLVVPLLVAVCVPAFLAGNNNHFLYGDSSASSTQGEIATQRERITQRFGVYNPVVLIVPSGDGAREKSLARELLSKRYIRDVQSLVTVTETGIPREVLPASLLGSFEAGGYSRMIVLLSVTGETDETFAAVDDIKASAEKFYPGKWLAAGTATSIADIKASIDSDSLEINLFSLLMVALVVLLTFRSFSLPVILVGVIQASIWINMSVPYFTGSSLVYIGYLVVSSLQLGATIDYAILLSSRYMENRGTMPPKQAAISAVRTAGLTVVVSALILTVAGVSEGILSSIGAVSEIGMLLGRGAALSGLLVLVVLPALLVILDKFIMKTTLRPKPRSGESTDPKGASI